MSNPMDYFYYDKEKLCVESVSIDNIAKTFDTPLYLYSRNAIEKNFLKYKAPLEKHNHRICYAVKANSNLAVLNILARLGANFDIVSVGELERVLTAGGKPSNIVFSGFGVKDPIPSVLWRLEFIVSILNQTLSYT